MCSFSNRSGSNFKGSGNIEESRPINSGEIVAQTPLGIVQFPTSVSAVIFREKNGTLKNKI